MQEKNPWKRIKSTTVYENPWIKLREDVVIRPDGREGIYGVVEIAPSVGVVVLDEVARVLLVGQWRYTHDKFSWEIPTGGSNANEPIIDAAKRELAEETGIQASNWEPLGSIDNSNGATTDVAHLFMASRLKSSKSTPEPTEDIVAKWFDFREAITMVMKGEITESCSVAALLKVEKLMRSDEVDLN